VNSIVKYVSKFFQNNGHLRGALYFTAAALGGVTGAFTHWAETPPKNWYEVTAEFLGAFSAGVIAVRAYLDTHLSRTKDEAPKTTSGAAPTV
jgi:hypothetical protein